VNDDVQGVDGGFVEETEVADDLRAFRAGEVEGIDADGVGGVVEVDERVAAPVPGSTAAVRRASQRAGRTAAGSKPLVRDSPRRKRPKPWPGIGSIRQGPATSASPAVGGSSRSARRPRKRWVKTLGCTADVVRLS
jgi:hypothetical protein